MNVANVVRYVGRMDSALIQKSTLASCKTSTALYHRRRLDTHIYFRRHNTGQDMGVNEGNCMNELGAVDGLTVLSSPDFGFSPIFPVFHLNSPLEY